MHLPLTLALALILTADERPTIGFTSTDPEKSPGIVVRDLQKETIAGLKEAKDWHPVFRVVVGGGTRAEILARPAVAGTYSVTDGDVRFDPQFAFLPGLEYVAIVHDLPNGEPMLATLALPKPEPGPRVSVTAVYPSANRLPENTLRLYVHFSGPMTRGNVYRHMKLVRDDGVEVIEPFLEVEQELWSRDGNRLTVLFHPGRVKRNLVPREEEGPILEEGRTFTFHISEKWLDTEGRPLVRGVSKTFSVGPPDDDPVNLNNWIVMAPRAGSRAPVIARLSKPLDHALLGRLVSVEDADGNRVAGEITVGGGERVLTFAPEKPWTKGDYKLVADTRLEDVCGNRVGRSFEVDEFHPITPKIVLEYSSRPFTVR